MNTLVSDDERRQTVRNFLVARYDRKATITSYSEITTFLNEQRIKPLCQLTRSGEKSRYSALDRAYVLDKVYDDSDAERYFEWLVAVLEGTEYVSEEIVKQANDQLFRFIGILGDEVEIDETVQLIAPYDWQKLFQSFDERLIQIQKAIIKGENDIAETLSKILLWIKKYGSTLDNIEKDRKVLFGKGKKR
jgi:hypothetical protein